MIRHFFLELHSTTQRPQHAYTLIPINTYPQILPL
jgi:hypothetical protein